MHAKFLAATLAALVGWHAGAASAQSDRDATAAPRRPECARLPSEALMRLPPPLDGWARLDCTPAGQILVSHRDWIWRYPASYTSWVWLPAWLADAAQLGQGIRYFVSAEVTVARGEEAAVMHRDLAAQVAVYRAMTEGRPAPAEVYTATLLNETDQALRVHFLFHSRQDVWAVVCAPDCSEEYSFIMSARGN